MADFDDKVSISTLHVPPGATIVVTYPEPMTASERETKRRDFLRQLLPREDIEVEVRAPERLLS